VKSLGRIAALGAGVLALAGCWPVPGQNADRTAYNSVETGLTPGTVGDLTQAWAATTIPGRPLSAPVVSGGGVHVVVDGCALGTVRPEDGTLLWARTVDVTGICDPFAPNTYIIQYTPPYVVGDRVLYGYRFRRPDTHPPIDVGSGAIRSYDIATGADAAGPRPPSEFARGVRGDLLLGSSDRQLPPPMPVPAVFFASNGTIAVVSLSDAGAPPRQFATAGGGPPTLGVDAIFQASNTTVSAYDVDEAHPGCGTDASLECPVWQTPIDGNGTDPVLAPGGDSVVYVGTTAGTVYALDAATGAVRWSVALGAAVSAPPALAEGVLYVPTADQRVVAVDAADGAAQWTAATAGVVGVQPAVAGGVVYTGSRTGTVEAFAAAGCGAATCPPLWSAGAGAAITGAPAVASGSVYVGTADGHLVAYRRPGT